MCDVPARCRLRSAVHGRLASEGFVCRCRPPVVCPALRDVTGVDQTRCCLVPCLDTTICPCCMYYVDQLMFCDCSPDVFFRTSYRETARSGSVVKDSRLPGSPPSGQTCLVRNNEIHEGVGTFLFRSTSSSYYYLYITKRQPNGSLSNVLSRLAVGVRVD